MKFVPLIFAAAVLMIPASASAQYYNPQAFGTPPAAYMPQGQVYNYGPGYANMNPWYLDPQYGTRRFYQTNEPNQFPAPVYTEPNYRFDGGYPHAYPNTGYVYPYPQNPHQPQPTYPAQPNYQQQYPVQPNYAQQYPAQPNYAQQYPVPQYPVQPQEQRGSFK